MERDSRAMNGGFFSRPMHRNRSLKGTARILRASQENAMSEIRKFQPDPSRQRPLLPSAIPAAPAGRAIRSAPPRTDLDRLGIEAAQELLRLILDRARQGNLKAADMVLQRVWPVRRNRPVDMEVPFGSHAAQRASRA
jgi:hypothetical protein